MKDGKITVELDLVEALAVGQTLRSLARDHRTPKGVDKALLDSVGTKLAHAALAGAGGHR